jgi:hypothetical protein
MALVSRKMKEELNKKRKRLQEEEALLKIEASKIRQRRTEIRDELEDIKEVEYTQYLKEIEKLRFEATTIRGYLDDMVVLWNQLPKNLTYPRVVKITVERELVTTSVRNTHHAPRGKKSNWKRSEDLPKGYPGLYIGSLSIEFRGKDALRGEYKHPLEEYESIIYIGSGGSRSPSSEGYERLGWDGALFFEDFPKIWEKLKDIKLFKGKSAHGWISMEDLDTLLKHELEDLPKLIDHPKLKHLVEQILEGDIQYGTQ